jgi:hypothetical protein
VSVLFGGVRGWALVPYCKTIHEPLILPEPPGKQHQPLETSTTTNSSSIKSIKSINQIDTDNSYW